MTETEKVNAPPLDAPTQQFQHSLGLQAHLSLLFQPIPALLFTDEGVGMSKYGHIHAHGAEQSYLLARYYY